MNAEQSVTLLLKNILHLYFQSFPITESNQIKYLEIVLDEVVLSWSSNLNAFE